MFFLNGSIFCRTLSLACPFFCAELWRTSFDGCSRCTTKTETDSFQGQKRLAKSSFRIANKLGTIKEVFEPIGSPVVVIKAHSINLQTAAYSDALCSKQLRCVKCDTLLILRKVRNSKSYLSPWGWLV